jgi:predicted transposase YdaD
MTAAQQLRREGRKEGMQEERLSIAKNMLVKLHLDIVTVQKATELTKEEPRKFLRKEALLPNSI